MYSNQPVCVFCRFTYFNSCLLSIIYIKTWNRIGGVIVSMLASSAVDLGSSTVGSKRL